MNIEKFNPKTLENGAVIISEETTEEENFITFEISLDRPVDMEDLKELWEPESPHNIILEKLREKGWVERNEDNTTLAHFKMDVLHAEKGRKWVFRYYKETDTNPTN